MAGSAQRGIRRDQPPGHLLPPHIYWLLSWAGSHPALCTVIAVVAIWSCGLRHFQGNLSAIISGDGKQSFSTSYYLFHIFYIITIYSAM